MEIETLRNANGAGLEVDLNVGRNDAFVFMEIARPIPSIEPGLQADQRLVDRGWLRIGAGVAVAAQAMVFSLAINLSEIDGWAYAVVHGILIASAAGSLIFLGGDLVRSAWDSVYSRKISIDLLFLVTLGGAFAGSLVSTFTRTGSVYYEVVAILIVVHTAGKMLGARSRVAALRAVDETREKFEFCDVVNPARSVTRMRATDVAAGTLVRVAPGGGIAVDGEIAAGRGYVQETSMTGEWRPVSRGPGDAVLAGTFSVDGSFDIRVTGGPRRLDTILDAVGQARLAPSRLQQQADRLMAWFLPLVVGVSVATFAFWLVRGTWDRALFNAMAVLLVACPCAMGLATPVAVWGGLARLAGLGVVARTGDFLDVLSRVDTLCIDKTGTLSEETLAVKDWRFEPAFREREVWLRATVAAVEQGLAHPVAEALRAESHVLRDTYPMTLEVRERRIIPGQGVIAEVEAGEAGHARLAVGEASLGKTLINEMVQKDEIVFLGGGRDECHVLRDTSAGKAVWIFVDGALAARVELEERWRAGLTETFDALRRLGVGAEVLSGDPSANVALAGQGLQAALAPEVCNVIRYKRCSERGGGAVVGTDRVEARTDGVAVLGGLTAEQKLARVEALVGANRTVLFVGDGLNDAAAMSAAQASIAMRTGADLARASAMAVFVGDDLRFLPRAIRLARAARRSIRINLLFAAGYNLMGMALAAAGLLHPVAAALLMLGSSVFVSINALRTGRDLTNVGR
jgi:cation transport ATPase